MHQKDYNRLDKLAENWISIADRLENQPVVMTANTHRLFANELRVVLSRIKVDTPWYRRLFNKSKGI